MDRRLYSIFISLFLILVLNFASTVCAMEGTSIAFNGNSHHPENKGHHSHHNSEPADNDNTSDCCSLLIWTIHNKVSLLKEKVYSNVDFKDFSFDIIGFYFEELKFFAFLSQLYLQLLHGKFFLKVFPSHAPPVSS